MNPIDELIATRVMGWTPDKYGCWAEGTHPGHGGRVRWCKEDSDGLDVLNDAEVFSPSTDPAAMMVVVNHKPMHFLHDGRGKWQAREITYVQDPTASPWLDTMMMAACWHALLAVGTPEAEIQAAIKENA